MGFRGIIRDLLSLYVGYKVFVYSLSGNITDPSLTISALILFLMAIWFILERIGIIPKI